MPLAPRDTNTIRAPSGSRSTAFRSAPPSCDSGPRWTLKRMTGRTVARIEMAARQHLGQHHPEGSDIGAAVHRLAFGLLGAHVRRRPHDYASLRGAHGNGG